MNTEREKTGALSDAVEINSDKPEGATHYRKMFVLCNNIIIYYKHQFGKWYYHIEKFGWFPSRNVTSIDQLKEL